MADSVKISALPASTDAQMTDAGLIETAVADTSSSTGFTSKKSTLARLATYILNKFAGLSLAGSQQTVKSALDSLNSNLYHLNRGTALPSGADLDSYTTVGTYYSGGASISGSLSNCPVTTVGFKLTVKETGYVGNYLLQTIEVYNRNDGQRVFVRSLVSASPVTWSDWIMQPVRTEMDALSEIYTGTTNFTAIDPIQPNNARGIGAWLDAKVHAQISTFSTGEVHSVAGVNDSVAYGASFYKASDSYYAGIIWSYHNNARNTAWYFKYSNGTYKLRPLAKPIAD